jgi:zinc transporter ZupT
MSSRADLAMIAIPLAFIAFASTLAGGFFTLRHRKHLHLIMGFTAGVLLGVVAFDILPEIVAMVQRTGADPRLPMLGLVGGFLAFHVLEKSVLIHHSHEGDYAVHKHPHVGLLSALALAGHSFMDGVGIGLGFQVSNSVGALVALAVVTHDFSDGVNTVSLMLAHDNSTRRAVALLMLDAVAPIAGAALTLLFAPSALFLLMYLGFFAGFLLYIGASDILPEAHSERSSPVTVVLTVLGTALVLALSTVL